MSVSRSVEEERGWETTMAVRHALLALGHRFGSLQREPQLAVSKGWKSSAKGSSTSRLGRLAGPTRDLVGEFQAGLDEISAADPLLGGQPQDD